MGSNRLPPGAAEDVPCQAGREWFVPHSRALPAAFRASTLASGVIFGCVLTLPLGAEVSSLDLQAQLHEIAAAHGFSVQGADKLGDDPGKVLGGSFSEQIKTLLADYNHVVIGGPHGISRVLILGPKQAAVDSSRPIVVATRRRGAHHIVDLVLGGPGGARLPVSLMLDTGASNVVLPASLIERLGFKEDDLRAGSAQTANGRIAVRRGMLRFVEIGTAQFPDVSVSFIPDAKLDGGMLLGMSFLERFQVTIDDTSNQLTLIAR